MPVIFKAIGVFLASAIPGIIARVLGAIGIGVISYAGVNLATNQIVSSLQSNFSNIATNLLSLLGIAGFDVFVSLVISTHVGALAFIVSMGGFKKLSFLKG